MTIDAQSALAALAASKDIESLESAIKAAAFLDQTPGDNRQKLRGSYPILFISILCTILWIYSGFDVLYD